MLSWFSSTQGLLPFSLFLFFFFLLQNAWIPYCSLLSVFFSYMFFLEIFPIFMNLNVSSCLWLSMIHPHPVFLLQGRLGFPQWLGGKESACNARDVGDAVSIPWSGKSPGRGHGNPLQYFFLENPMDTGAWWVMVQGVTRSNMEWSHLVCMHVQGCSNISWKCYRQWQLGNENNHNFWGFLQKYS